VRDMEVGQIDYVVAMDPAVYEILNKIHLVPREKLILWRIEDPFSQSLKHYLRTAEKLNKKIQEGFDISSLSKTNGG